MWDDFKEIVWISCAVGLGLAITITILIVTIFGAGFALDAVLSNSAKQELEITMIQAKMPEKKGCQK